MKQALVQQLESCVEFQLKDGFIKPRIVWWSRNCKATALGLKKLGYEVSGFLARDLEALSLERKTVLKGNIRTVRKALELLGVSQPENIDIPQSLKKYALREIWETTMGAVRARGGELTFIKPLRNQKFFAGHLHNPNDLFSKFPDQFPILAQEPVQFGPEWRVYVLKGEILGIHRYRRNTWAESYSKVKQTFNSRSRIQEMITAFKDSPIAYGLDVGYIHGRDKELALVEVNDAFGLGNYGLNSINYSRMVEARWKEMVCRR